MSKIRALGLICWFETNVCHNISSVDRQLLSIASEFEWNEIVWQSSATLHWSNDGTHSSEIRWRRNDSLIIAEKCNQLFRVYASTLHDLVFHDELRVNKVWIRWQTKPPEADLKLNVSSKFCRHRYNHFHVLCRELGRHVSNIHLFRR